MEEKSKLELIGEIAQANNKNLELIEEINKKEDEIERLNKELEGKNKVIDAMIDNEEEYCIEINRLNNIINELEKYCNDEINEGNKALEKLSEIYNSSDTESYIKGQQAKCKHILNKLQELKGDGSNEKDTNE